MENPLFLELFEALPRQGPGSRESTARALELSRDLPPGPPEKFRFRLPASRIPTGMPNKALGRPSP